MTPEQKAEFDKARLLPNRKEYAKLALGMFAAAPATYPLEFTYAGEAEAPEGKADIIDVKGEGDFSCASSSTRTRTCRSMLTLDGQGAARDRDDGRPGGMRGPSAGRWRRRRGVRWQRRPAAARRAR